MCSGLLLYLTAWSLAWLLAELRLPTELYPHALLIRGSTEAVLSEAGLIAALLLGLALLWAYLTVRSPKRGRRPTAGWFFLGLGLAWFGGLMGGVVRMSGLQAAAEMPLAVLLFAANQAPLWGLMNLLALLLGAGLAAGLAASHYRKLGGGGRRAVSTHAMMRAHEPRLEESPASEDSAWADTCPMSDLPTTPAGLHLSMGSTGR